jgi:hypothetical protein
MQILQMFCRSFTVLHLHYIILLASMCILQYMTAHRSSHMLAAGLFQQHLDWALSNPDAAPSMQPFHEEIQG